MELFFLCTALSLHVLDHCMKLYWKRKTQRTAGPTDRPTDQPTDQPTDHRVTPIYPPKLRFGGIMKLILCSRSWCLCFLSRYITAHCLPPYRSLVLVSRVYKYILLLYICVILLIEMLILQGMKISTCLIFLTCGVWCRTSGNVEICYVSFLS